MRTPRRRIVGSVVGLLLVGAAVWAVAGSGDAMARALEHARSRPWWMVGLVLVLPLANWCLVSFSFWALMRRHGPIAAGEMHALVGMAWLLNYLPLRLGMVGRITYHKVVNGIGVADSIRVMLALMGMTLASAAAMGGATLAGEGLGPIAWSIALVAPGVLAGAGACAAGSRWSPLLWALAIRYADMGVWAARYAVLFAIVGAPLTPSGAVGVALVSQAASIVPISGNGMGVREWAVGLFAGVLPTSLPGEAVGAGLAADLINRAAELAVSVPLGMVSARWVSRRIGRMAIRSVDADPGDEPGRPWGPGPS